jgi:integrase
MNGHLTKSTIDKAEYEGMQYKNGSWQRYFLWDLNPPGFGLRITPKGSKQFIFQYRVNGRIRLHTIGRYPALSVQKARAKANEMAAALELHGADPRDKREAEKREIFFGAFCDEYIERHASVHKKSWKKDESRLDRFAKPIWKNRALKSITRSEIEELHRRIGLKTPYEANRLLEVLSKMLELARDWGHIEESAPNPAKRIQPFTEIKRERWVSKEELPRLVRAISNEPNEYIRNALLLFLLVPVRKNELLRAKWEHIDWNLKEFLVPDNKSGKPYHIPLSSEAVSVLRKITTTEGNPYIFPGRLEGRHLVNIEKNWRRIRSEAKLEDVRLHDLRRTVGAWLAEHGTSLLIIQKAFNHASPSTTQIYARLSENPVRDALDSHGGRIGPYLFGEERVPNDA